MRHQMSLEGGIFLNFHTRQPDGRGGLGRAVGVPGCRRAPAQGPPVAPGAVVGRAGCAGRCGVLWKGRTAGLFPKAQQVFR